LTVIGLSTNLLWRIQIDWRKKLALVGICSLTSFIIAVAIARVVVATADTNFDLTFLILWGGVELTVGKSLTSTSMITNFPD
jgi:predicted ABC-type sugar transport system permease subunit